ncbi:MAG: hypothetical protein ACI84O_000293 [Myxococcota bacterium]|jgi:hypothetical protein
MRILAICLSLILGLNYVASNSGPMAQSGQLSVAVIDLKFVNNYYELLTPDEGTFIVIERIDSINEHAKNTSMGYYDANNKSGALEFYIQREGKRRYGNPLTAKDLVADGAQGMAITGGFTLEARNPSGANAVILSYRIYSL